MTIRVPLLRSSFRCGFNLRWSRFADSYGAGRASSHYGNKGTHCAGRSVAPGSGVLVPLAFGIALGCAAVAASLLGAMPAGFLIGWALLLAASLLLIGWLARRGRSGGRAARDRSWIGAPVDEALVDRLLQQTLPDPPLKSVLIVGGHADAARNLQEGLQDLNRHAITIADTLTAIDWIVENEDFFEAIILDVPGLGLGPCRAFCRDLQDLGRPIPVVLASSFPTHGLRAAFADFEPVLLIAVSGGNMRLRIELAGMFQEIELRGMGQSGSPGKDRLPPGKGWTPRVIHGGGEIGG